MAADVSAHTRNTSANAGRRRERVMRDGLQPATLQDLKFETMDPIQRVRKGMRVLDATGVSLGTVSEIRFNDAEAATATGQSSGHHSGSERQLTGRTRTGWALPRQRRELLERIGYVKVDAGGLLGDDTYFCADDIIAVQRDTVHITHRTRRPVQESTHTRLLSCLRAAANDG